MADSRDPIQRHSRGDDDWYEVTTWHVRSWFDQVAVLVYGGALSALRGLVVLLAVVILLFQFALGGLGAVSDPLIGAFTLLSVVPALVIAAYIWRADVTQNEPLELLVATFVLGVLFAGFAAVGNTFANSALAQLGVFGVAGFAGQLLFFFVVVGPLEESVKLLAVRLFAFRKPAFDAVIDGAVYGAVAGFGFATIENAIYISQTAMASGGAEAVVAQGGSIAAVRALAGPGHVIYSALAGYYLGLAKFNREHAGPIVVKGLLIAAILHATYNSLAGVVPTVIATVFDVSPFLGLLAFVVVYDGVIGLALLRKLGRYRRAYRRVTTDETDPRPEPTEFDG